MSNSLVAVTRENHDSFVLQASTPVFLYFRADWCVTCKSVVRLIEDLASQYDSEILTFGCVDVGKDEDLGVLYNVSGLPSYRIVESGTSYDIQGQPTKTSLDLMLTNFVSRT